MGIRKIFRTGTLLFVLLFTCNSLLLAQDTDFWFVAPNIDPINTSYCDQPVRMVITAGAKPVTATLYYKGGDKQIPVQLAAGATQVISFTRVPAAGEYSYTDIENQPANNSATKNKYGIHLVSDNPVYASYMADGACLKDLFTLKGGSALGKEFFLSFQNKYALQVSAYPSSRRSFHIVASEDNTNITINLKNSTLEGCGASTTLNITLNAGETWAGVGSNYLQSLFGTRITSDKDIAVTVYESTFNGDMIGDQIVPIDQLAKSYIVLRTYPAGRQVTGSEYAFIMATKPNTTLTIVDASKTSTTKTLTNAGDMYELPVTSEYYMVEGSEPVYIYQLSGYLSSPYQESGASLLPSMYSIQSRDISFFKSNSSSSNALNHYIFIITHKDNVDGFLVNGDATKITAADFTTFVAETGLADWRYVRLQINSWPNGVNAVRNTKGAFSLGYMFGDNTCGSYGYLSGFGNFSFPEVTYKCVGQSLVLHASYAKDYRWWKGRATETSNPTISTGSSYTVPADQEGYYSVEINMDPKTIVVETYVKNDVLNLSTTIPEYVQVNSSASFSATVTRPEGKIFGWTFADANQPTATGPTVNNVTWAATGSKAITLTIKNTDLGCSDDVTTKTVHIYDIQDDYASTTKDKAAAVDVLANDVFPTLTTSISSIATSPQHGSAGISGSKITYTPDSDFIGYDSLRYEVTYGAHKVYAWLRLSVSENLDNISDADCFGDPPKINFSFNLLSSSPAANPVNDYNMAVVGDIDNDGYTEIIVGRTSNSGVSTNQLHIFKFKDNKIVHQQTLNTPYFNNVANPYSIAKVDDNDYAAIFLCTDIVMNAAANQGRLIKYVYNTGTKLYEEFTVGGNTKRGIYSNFSRKEMAQPMIVDFNADGIAEVVTYDKVFNASTMELLANGELLQYSITKDGTAMGFGYGGHINNNQQNDESSSVMAIGDVDGDGMPEVVGGNCAYKVTITNPNGTSGNNFRLWSTCSKTGPGGEVHPEAVDGVTALADMDGDGLLDVIVTNGRYRNPSGYGGLYIWNPRTGKVMHTNIISNLPIPAGSGAFAPSVAFIGDIDNTDKKNQPEVCFTAYMKSYAFTYDPVAKTLTQKWVINTDDTSGATTMVMFDFDQDGDNELVYRDTQNLRIINGKDGVNKINVTACGSPTAIEYPVVADINDDGAAEIVVTCGGQVRVYASNPVGTWAPARKVWNQFAYNSVNINEDLTVPKVQFNPTSTLTGSTCGDVRPYNGYLLQQTTLNKYGCPIFLLPNLNFNGDPAYSYHTKGDSLLITVKFKNDGDAAIGPPVHVSVYKDAISTANFMATASANIMLLSGQTNQCTIKVENISSFKPYSKLVVRLNDNGSGIPVQQECIDGDNEGFKPHNQMLIAVNDTLAIPTNSTGMLADVLDNDQLASCPVDSVTLSIVTAKSPTKGTASISDQEISFIPIPSYVGIDSLQYKLTCGSDMATAELYIVVQALLKVEWIEDAAESGKKGKCRISFIETGATYSRDLEITYQFSGGSAVSGTDYTDVLTGKVKLLKNNNSVEFDIVTPKNNYKVEGNSRTVEVTITKVDVL